MLISILRAQRLQKALNNHLVNLIRMNGGPVSFDHAHAKYMALNGISGNIAIRIAMARNSLGIDSIEILRMHHEREMQILIPHMESDKVPVPYMKRYEERLRYLRESIAESNDSLDRLYSDTTIEVADNEVELLSKECIIA